MDEDKKKLVMIIVAVSCIVLAVGITYFTSGPSRPKGSDTNVLMLCDSCGENYELTREEYREEMQKLGPQMMMMRGPVILTCKQCGEVAAYVATKCPECGEVFVLGDAGDEQYPDRCPGCGHSDIESRSNR